MFFPLAMLSQYIFGPALFLISVFIVLIILLQRGRGGGLTGALGGAGGASAFGVKAGDIFTRITAIAVLIWIVLCAVTCYWYLPSSLDIATTPSSSASERSGGMGGMSGGELPPSPQDLEALLANPTAPASNLPASNLPASTEPAAAAIPPTSPPPTDLPPGPSPEIKDIPSTPAAATPAAPTVDPASLPPATPAGTDPKS